MKHTILHAFTQYQAQMDKSVRSAVEKFCEPDNINSIVAEAVDRTLRDVISKEVESFFRYGAGGTAIKEEITRKLSVCQPKKRVKR